MACILAILEALPAVHRYDAFVALGRPPFADTQSLWADIARDAKAFYTHLKAANDAPAVRWMYVRCPESERILRESMCVKRYILNAMALGDKISLQWFRDAHMFEFALEKNSKLVSDLFLFRIRCDQTARHCVGMFALGYDANDKYNTLHIAFMNSAREGNTGMINLLVERYGWSFIPLGSCIPTDAKKLVVTTAIFKCNMTMLSYVSKFHGVNSEYLRGKLSKSLLRHVIMSCSVELISWYVAAAEYTVEEFVSNGGIKYAMDTFIEEDVEASIDILCFMRDGLGLRAEHFTQESLDRLREVRQDLTLPHPHEPGQREMELTMKNLFGV